jgi:hypothetical protein
VMLRRKKANGLKENAMSASMCFWKKRLGEQRDTRRIPQAYRKRT